MYGAKTLMVIVVQAMATGAVIVALFVFYTSNLPTPAPAQMVQVLPEQWRVEAVQWGTRLGLPQGLLEATCAYESANAKPRSVALSHKGAVGACQVLPITAAWLLGIDNPTIAELVELHRILTKDDSINVMFGGRYLAYCYGRRWHRNEDVRVRRALWCYNNGHNSKRPRGGSVYELRVLATWELLTMKGY